jgi:hypothetical protein
MEEDEKKNKDNKPKSKPDMKDWDNPGVKTITIEAFEKADKSKKKQN